MSIRIIQGNALDLPLDDDSVDLVVTSPPYFGLRSYQDGGEHYAGQVGAEATPVEFVDALIAATREMVRVVKPTGSIWVNLGDKYASYEGNRGGGGKISGRIDPGRNTAPKGSGLSGGGFVQNKSLMGIPWRYAIRCIDELGLILRAEVIWSKPNGLPESVRDRVRRSHEQWFHFALSPRYYANLDEVREPYEWDYSKGYKMKGNNPDASRVLIKGGDTRPLSDPRRNMAGHREVERGANPLGKVPGSVWRIATQPLRVPAELGVDHFAAFPMEWPRRIIAGWSSPDGTVLDPFGGTGTTALVADVLGRDGISVDLSADYCRLAEWRTQDPKERARVLKEKVKPKPVAVDPVTPVDAPGVDEKLW